MTYVELHAHSYYSLLDGASSPEALVRRASEVEMRALALTDHDALSGAIPFARAAQQYGIRPVFGVELTLEDGAHLTLLVENESGWRNLCRLITHARHHAPKGEALLPVDALEQHTEGLIALSGCVKGAISRAIRRKQYKEAVATATRYRHLFGGTKFWIELQHHGRAADRILVDHLAALAEYLNIGCIATNNVHYATRDHHPLQDVLVAIRHNVTLDESRPWRRPNSEYYLKSPQQMSRLFQKYPQAVRNTLAVAEQCAAELPSGLQELPRFPTPSALTASQYLRLLCEEVFEQQSFPSQNQALALLAHELNVIERCGLSNYFLIVWDIVRFARENGILCQGRGSAANSLVAYLLGISPVDPISHNLVFERFLSEERVSVPDIDMDFDASRREEVIQYVYRRYGAEHTAMACTFITYRYRSAIRDIGKALGFPPTMLEEAVLAVERGDDIQRRSRAEHQLADLCEQLRGHPRHLGIHNGGMVIFGFPLVERIPTEPATMQDRVVVQWDKEQLETAGIVKIDILGLRMLSAIAESVALVEQATGQRPDLDSLTYDDPALFQTMTAGDTVGIFQVESRAQAQTLPRLKPKTFNDLIVSISLIRPGPVQGNMVHPYLRRRAGTEAVYYPHDSLEAALEETLGVILFQEQVLKVARDLAGFTAGQGEVLRRALGGKRPGREVEKLRGSFVNGARDNGVLEDVANAVFESLKAFGGYSFPKSHAAAFAVLVYQSAWLKQYHPTAFYTALLNNQPMGFWSPAVIANDARRHGIGIARVDANRSRARCTVEGNTIRIGFQYVTGFGEANARKIEDAQRGGKFSSLRDFCRRTQLPRRLVESLIWVGAFDEWGKDRRKLAWELGRVNGQEDGLPLAFADDGVALPPLSRFELLKLETEFMALTTGDHMMTFYQQWMKKGRVLGSRALRRCRNRQKVKIAGQVVMHQAPPTANGVHFITLEDEDGMMNVIVWPNVYKRYRRVLRHAPLLFITGEVQQVGDITNVLCEQAAILPPLHG
jgi:error-prone DNA polymerase